MLPSWITFNALKKDPQKGKDLKHYILGSALRDPLQTNEEEIILGCGCFWGAEKGFWKLPGVITTAVGYSGGKVKSPSYNQVCSGNTGHTEVVRVVWNKSIIDLSDLLKLFWECHDPTQGNRQGNDSGSQYRSAIYTTKDEQMDLVISSKNHYQEALNGKGLNKITTEIKYNQQFFYAEDYHQQYLAKPGSRPYCSAMPTKISLTKFPGSNFKLDAKIWSEFNWEINHCVLRSNNEPIKLIKY